jgi:hypothetical protein
MKKQLMNYCVVIDMKTDMNDYYNCMNELLIVLHKYKNSSLRPRHLEMILCDCLEFIKTDFTDTTDEERK